MFCINCGTEIKEGSMFCPNCGSKVDSNIQQVQDDIKTVILSEDADMAQEKEQEVTQNGEPEAEESTAADKVDVADKDIAPEEKESADITAADTGIVVRNESAQSKFCPNCGTENSIDDMFCKECGMPLGGSFYGTGAAGQGMQMVSAESAAPKKKKRLLIGIGAAAVVLVLVAAAAIMAMSGLFMGPSGKVLKAVAATMKDTPELVKDLKVIPDILTGNQYTAGFSMGYDGDTINGEFRNTVSDKQIYISADMDGNDIDFLCGVHSGILKAAISDLDYVFMYDPKGENDGFLCKQVRKKQLKEFNSLLENITTEKVTVKEIQKDVTAAFMQEFKELEFKEVKSKEFEVDKKDRECKGYKVNIDEKDIARFLKNAGERVCKRLADEVVDDFEDMLDDLVDEIEDDDFDLDIIFYLYKGKLAAVVLKENDYNEEINIEFRGGDYRMQNIVISAKDDDDVMEVSCRKKGSKEVIEIDVNGYEDITITYDTKSGAVSLEYDSRWTDSLIEGTYKHSGSEVSFTLEEYEYDGDSLMDDEDISLTVYAKKAVQIEKYKGKEFDLGTADEDDFEDLEDDLEDYIDLLYDLFY